MNRTCWTGLHSHFSCSSVRSTSGAVLCASLRYLPSLLHGTVGRMSLDAPCSCCFDDEDSRQWLNGRNAFLLFQPSVSMRNPFIYVLLIWSYTRVSSSTFLERLRLTSESSMMRLFLRTLLVRGTMIFFIMAVSRNSINLRQLDVAEIHEAVEHVPLRWDGLRRSFFPW